MADAATDGRRCSHCNATPDPSESPDTGNYEENGERKYLCYRCWLRECGMLKGEPS